MTGLANHCKQPELILQTELAYFEDCILWVTCVLIPPQKRQQLLQELHIEHSGMSRIKSLARTVIWWSKLDSDIEDMVEGCNEVDFVDPFLNHMLLIIIDAGSKWIKAFPMQTSMSNTTIQYLKICLHSWRSVTMDHYLLVQSLQFLCSNGIMH